MANRKAAAPAKPAAGYTVKDLARQIMDVYFASGEKAALRKRAEILERYHVPAFAYAVLIDECRKLRDAAPHNPAGAMVT